MEPTRAQVEQVIAASLIIATPAERTKFTPEIIDLTADCFSIPMFKAIFTAFMAGKIDDHPIKVKHWHALGNHWTHAGNIRFYCLELLKAIKECK